MTPRFVPDLIDVEQELFELPQRVSVTHLPHFHSTHSVHVWQERVTYNKEIQTTDMETEIDPSTEEEIRQRVLRERELAEAVERQREKELEEESVQLDKEIEQEIRGASFRFLPQQLLG